MISYKYGSLEHAKEFLYQDLCNTLDLDEQELIVFVGQQSYEFSKDLMSDLFNVRGLDVYRKIANTVITSFEYDTKSKYKVKEAVNHPEYYGGKNNPFEVIKIIEHFKLGFCLGNVVKYILRAGKKDPEKWIEDLKKARWYLDREIQNLENESNTSA